MAKLMMAGQSHGADSTSPVTLSLVFLGVLSNLSHSTMAASVNNNYGENSLVNTENEPVQTSDFKISLYPWNDHLGRELKMDWSAEEASTIRCKSIHPRFLGKVRSINTYDQCVVLYSRDGCRGNNRVIKRGSPSHNRLSDICFHRKTASVRPCTSADL